MSEHWTTADIPDQTGRTFLVTGANSGLGLETTRHLARRGARVIMAVRDEAKGRAAAAELADVEPGTDLEIRRLDLADLESVKAFAERLRADNVAIDVLVNNAGIMAPPRRLSPQGHESQFATNHLGHFALTGLLLDRIERGREPRVVTVSSIAHHRIDGIHFDDLTGEKRYASWDFYAQSKFANMLFGLELHRRLSAADSPVRSLMAHPGVAATDLARSIAPLFRPIVNLGFRMVSQPAEAGALPQLYAATDPRAESGQYIGPDGRREIKGHPVVVRPNPAAADPAMAERLWTLSEKLTGVRFPLGAAA